MVAGKLRLQPATKTGEGGEDEERVAGSFVQVGKIKSLCENTLENCTAVYADRESLHTMEAIYESARPSADWHAAQNARLRSCADSSEWLREQLGRGVFPQHYVQTWQVLQSMQALERCGLYGTMPRTLQSLHEDHPRLAAADEQANRLGRLCSVLIGKRVVRTLWLTRGWGARIHLLSSEDAGIRERTMASFREDYETFRDACGHLDNRYIAKMVERSPFVEVAWRRSKWWACWRTLAGR
jgi:hypothetical protein